MVVGSHGKVSEMAFWNREKTTKSWNLSVADLDKLMDIAVNGNVADAWGSTYYRGAVKKIAITVSNVPRQITTTNGVEVDEDDLPFKIDLDKIMYNSSMAKNRFGRAYWGLDTRGSRIDRVKWFNPATITEDTWPGRGLVSFTRRHTETQLNPILYKYNKDTERVEYGDNGGLGWVWSWGMQEIGPGDTLDDDVNLPATLLQWSDEMMRMLFMRGGINKWIAQAENRPSPEDEKRIRANMKNLLGGGVSNSSTFEVFSSLLKFMQVGTNPKDLEMETVNTSNKNDVSAGTLTPQILINPDMASNRSVMDRITSTWLSDVVLPDSKIIVKALNHHVFKPEGLKLKLKADSMGANQEDEVNRAQAWGTYVSLGANPNTVAAMLGLDIPEGMELMAPAAPQLQEPESTIRAFIPSATPKTAEWRDERRQFKAWYRKRIGGDITDFTAYHITDKDKEMVIAEVLESDVWEGY